MLGNARTSSAFAASSLAALASSSNGRLTRRQLQLKKDPDGNGKYIGALNEVRVHTQSVSYDTVSMYMCDHELTL
jgi:hypothetical protein